MSRIPALTGIIQINPEAGFDAWFTLFNDHSSERAKAVDESRTTVGKVSDTKAMVMLFDVDMAAFGASKYSLSFVSFFFDIFVSNFALSMTYSNVLPRLQGT